MTVNIGLTRSEFLKQTAVGAACLLTANQAAGQSSSQSPFRVADGHPTDTKQRLRNRSRGMLTLPYRVDDGEELIAVGRWAKANELVGDAYGSGGLIEAFESKMAKILGFDAACFMPTGVMALLTALRIYADRSNMRTVGMHPTSHHLLHQEGAHQVLHQLNEEVISPWDRPIQAIDIETSPELCAVSVEMPVRTIGGQLQTWTELQALKRVAKNRSLPLMMDGARLWECGPYYNRPYAEICDGFDSVYVSMYKIVGALSGAVLAGDTEFIEQSRRWRRRLGGDVYQHFPYVASAAMRFDAVIPKIAGYRDQAASLSRRLSSLHEVIALPADPPTNLFRLVLPGTRFELMAKRDTIARETGIWVANGFSPTRVPGLSQVELQIGPSYQTITEDEAVDAFSRLL